MKQKLRRTNTTGPGHVSPGKTRSGSKPPSDDSTPRPLHSVVFWTLAAFILAGVWFFIGRYMELNTPDAFDSGAYVYSAKHLLEGARLGVDEITTAQPATLLVNFIGVKLFGFSETGPKIIQALLQAIAFTIMFYALFRIYGPLAATVTVTVASFFLSAPVIAKFGNVKEQYMIAFMIITASGWMLYYIFGTRHWALICGAGLINIYYFKPTGVSVIIALAVFLIFQKLLGRRNWPNLFYDISLLLAGAIIGILPLVIFFLSLGQLRLLANTLPYITLQLCVMIFGVIAVAWCAAGTVRRFDIINRLRTVRWWIWLTGAVAIAALTTCSFCFVYFQEMDKTDAISFVRDITFIRYPLRFFAILHTRFDKFVSFFNLSGSYISDSYRAITFKKLAPQVLRYYRTLILPVILAFCAIALKIIRTVTTRYRTLPAREEKAQRLVLFLGLWWLLDMAFIWLSPHSYEQYYLPLNASAAMLGGYPLWIYSKKLAAADKWYWLLGGIVAAICMIALAGPLFRGLSTSPDTAAAYRDRFNNPERRRGYIQRLAEISRQKQDNTLYPWERAGDYIRTNSATGDKIFVWGWYPGIYIRAQRLSSVPSAFESNMHLITPDALTKEVKNIINAVSHRPCVFIVDSRKRHFPWDREPLELWPIVPKGLFGNREQRLLATDLQEISRYETIYSEHLVSAFGAEQAQRFAAMKPLRDFIMQNYQPAGMFGDHVVFRLKPDAPITQTRK